MKLADLILNACDHVIKYYEQNENDILKKSGVVLGIAAVVAACVSTHKSEKIIAKAKEDVEEIRETQRYSDVSEKEVKKELAITVGVAGLKVAGLMLIPAYFEYQSLKNLTTVADNYKAEALHWSGVAAATVAQVKEIMARVKEKYGQEAADEIYYGTRTEEITVMENGKEVKKKINMIDKPPVNHNILCFSPWTSSLYIDEEKYDCPGTNIQRITGVFKTLNIYLATSNEPFVSTNMIAHELGIAKSTEWYTEGKVKGEGILEYHVQTVYELYEGRRIPVYYIEVNTEPNLQTRISGVLPEAPIYTDCDFNNYVNNYGVLR